MLKSRSRPVFAEIQNRQFFSFVVPRRPKLASVRMRGYMKVKMPSTRTGINRELAAALKFKQDVPYIFLLTYPPIRPSTRNVLIQ